VRGSLPNVSFIRRYLLVGLRKSGKASDFIFGQAEIRIGYLSSTRQKKPHISIILV